LAEVQGALTCNSYWAKDSFSQERHGLFMSKEISRKVTGIGLAGFPFAFPENIAVKLTDDIDTAGTCVASLALCGVCRTNYETNAVSLNDLFTLQSFETSKDYLWSRILRFIQSCNFY
jgi:hypothetical protein